MQIYRLPILRDDETLYSIAARTRLQNAARDDRDACRSLFGTSSSIRIAEFPVNLEYFCKVTAGYFGDPRYVLQRTTLWGFFERIGGSPWRAAKWRRPVESAGYGLATLSNGNINTWRGCPQCLESDLSMFGTSYWRRAHQLPMAFFCHTHGTPLKLAVAANNDRHLQFLLPEQITLAVDYRAAELVPYESVLTRLSRLAHDVLLDTEDTSDLVHSQKTVLRAFQSRAMVTARGEVRLEDLTAELSHRYGYLKQSSDFHESLSLDAIGKLARSFRTKQSWRRPQHNLLLVDWLFGSWHSYRQQCAWQAVMDGPPRNEPAKAAAHSIDALSLHRKVCLDFMGHKKSPLRSEFFLSKRKSFNWLRQHDNEWFDLNFPSAGRTAAQALLF